ncbi:hypothetical protein LB505_006515 [Fusarium chuoi]|nr:hypothetical protein LB505_006515 [Fusarium chuoi]
MTPGSLESLRRSNPAPTNMTDTPTILFLRLPSRSSSLAAVLKNCANDTPTTPPSSSRSAMLHMPHSPRQRENTTLSAKRSSLSVRRPSRIMTRPRLRMHTHNSYSR